MVWNDSKMKNKLLEISSFYTCVPKTTIIRGTVPVIRSETDRIFCHFGPFFALSPHNNPQNQNFEKMKKKLYMSSFYTWVSKIMIIYASWDMECNRNNFLSFWAMFWPFTPLLTLKTKIWKKCKKCLEILSFYMCV